MLQGTQDGHIGRQLGNIVDEIVASIEDITKHITDEDRQKDLLRGMIASVILASGESGALVLQGIINAEKKLLPLLPDLDFYKEYLIAEGTFDAYMLSISMYADSYYAGKMIGDLVAAGFGLGMTIKGIFESVGGILGAGGGLALSSTGAAAPVGAAISAAGVAVTAAGIAEGAAGIAVATAAVGNFGGDFQKFQCESKENDISDYLDDWSKANRGSSRENIEYHYDRHGADVGAKNLNDYCRKARALRDTVLKKKLSYTPVVGDTDNVYRWKYNGRYIDMEIIQDGWQTIYKIVSYGAT